MKIQVSLPQSIRSKIILQMMMVSLIPIIIIAVIVYGSMFNSQQSASDSVDEARVEMQENVIAVSLENQAKAMALDMTGTVGDQILSLVQMVTATMVIGLEDIGNINMYMFSQAMILEDFKAFALTDPHGIVLVSTSPDIPVGSDLSSKSWWENIIAIQPVEGEQEMEMVLWLPISTPMNPDQVLGRIIGVVKMDSETSTVEYASDVEQGHMTVFYGGRLVADSRDSTRVFEENLSLSFVEKTAIAAVVEVDNDMKAGDRLSTVSGFVVDDEAGVVAAYFRPGAEETARVMPQILLDMNAEAVSSDEGDTSNQAAIIVMQQPKEVAFASIASLETLEDDLEGNTNTTIMLLIGVFAAVTLIVLAIAIWLSRVITNPLLNLHRGVEYIMEGNMDYRVGSSGTDEVGQLSQAFDHMTDNIQKSQDQLKEYSANLETKVQARTEELRATAEKLETIFETITDGIVIIDLEGTIVDVNMAGCTIAGYDRKEDVIGRNGLEFADDPDQIATDLMNAISGSVSSTSLVYPLTRKDGTRFFCEMAASVLNDSAGNPIGLIAVERDITERMEMEEAVRATAAKLQNILQSMNDGVAVVDMNGTIVEANAALAKMHGFIEKEDVIGKNNMELIAVKDHDRVMADMGETFEKRIPALHEYTMVRNDGSGYVAEMSTAALVDNDGNPTGAMAVIRDVTERKQAEQQILEAKTKLEAYATDLERSNKELDDFAYIASHDLKEPLRGIYNFSTFLIEDYSDKLDDEGKSKLQTLMKLTQRLEAYLNDLLYYSRAGRSEIAKEEINSGQIVHGVLNSLKAEISEKGVSITVAEDMPLINCDSAKISEAIRNLISNAIKYNDKDEKRVEIGWQKGEDGNPVFYVRDNGIGIREKHLNKIFKIFTRLHAKDQYGGGTGAGLTMARKIIQRHGGDIWVESEEGEGTTFYFTIGK